MVMKQDGTFLLMSEDEITQLRNLGKIKTIQPKAFQGRTFDYTQKPIRVLIE
jgi:hypothetical protein